MHFQLLPCILHHQIYTCEYAPTNVLFISFLKKKKKNYYYICDPSSVCAEAVGQLPAPPAKNLTLLDFWPNCNAASFCKHVHTDRSLFIVKAVFLLAIFTRKDKIVATVTFLDLDHTGLFESDFMSHWQLKQYCQPYSLKSKLLQSTQITVGCSMRSLSNRHAEELHWHTPAMGTFPQHGAVYHIQPKPFHVSIKVSLSHLLLTVCGYALCMTAREKHAPLHGAKWRFTLMEGLKQCL